MWLGGFVPGFSCHPLVITKLVQACPSHENSRGARMSNSKGSSAFLRFRLCDTFTHTISLNIRHMVGDLYTPYPERENIDMLPVKWGVSWNDWTKTQCSTSSNHFLRVYGVGFRILNTFRFCWISVAHTLQESSPLSSLL